MEQISYEDFAKLQIAVGTIVTVDTVPDADKLLKLMVDVGEEAPRQILSGIREYIADPQSLVGQQFPFLLNLAPRTIRGLESQGMILAGSHEDTLALLTPTASVPPGTKIR